MNKKECVNLINELFEKLDDAKRQIFELETELAKRGEEPAEQTPIEQAAIEPTLPEEPAPELVEETEQSEIAELKVKEQKTQEKVQEEVKESPKPEIPKPEISKTAPEEVILPKLKAAPEFTAIGEDLFYASEILGRIVSAATKYSNEAIENSQEKSEKINALIIAETEKAKEDITKCILSGGDLDEKKIDIYNVYNSALDSFEGLISE